MAVSNTNNLLPLARLFLWVLLVSSLQEDASAFTPTKAFGTSLSQRIPSHQYYHQRKRRPLPVLAARKKRNDDDDDDDEGPKTGMEDAFRQFDALDSLGEKEGLASTVKLDDDAKAALKSEAASMEKEVELFTSMLGDSDQDAYSDVMKDLGGTPKDLPPPPDKSERQISIVEGSVPSSSSTTSKSSQSNIPKSEEDTEKFMNQAIQEALDEARAMSPSDAAGKKMSDSILDDEEIMKEIEEIFEKGNEKLLASLEEIRKEQVRFVTTAPNCTLQIHGTYITYAHQLIYCTCISPVLYVCDVTNERTNEL